GVRHQAADPGLHTERAKEIAGYVLAIARIGGRAVSGPPHGEGSVTGLQSGQIGELRRLGTEVPVRLPREERKVSVRPLCVSTPIAAANLIPDAPKLLGFCNRK